VLGVTFTEMEQWTSKMVDVFFDETKLTDDDFTFDNDKLDNAIKQRALLETKRETYQAVEGLYHNLNTLQSRSGNQLPFTSINYGTCTLPEGRMVIKALLEVSIKGLGRYGKTSIFPCGIFQYMKGVNDKPGTPNYDLKRLALKATASRIYPNYANVDWTTNVAAIKQDRTFKRGVLERLTSEDKTELVNMMRNDENIRKFVEKFHFNIDESGELVVADEADPTEITATMGKCKL
jgi:ribonucleoside-triphosphate reductase